MEIGKGSPAIMFGILRDPLEMEGGYECVYFDLLSEEESEEAFEKLQKVEIVFNGYFPVDQNSPNGINPEVHERISGVVSLLNDGEDLPEERIQEILGPFLI